MQNICILNVSHQTLIRFQLKFIVIRASPNKKMSVLWSQFWLTKKVRKTHLPGCLFFEFSFENGFHVFELERADGRSLKAIGACGEDRVEGRVVVRRLVHVLKVSNKA